MYSNNNEQNLNHENIQKLSNLTSCERCKNNQSTLFCEQCKPFHYYCNQCDTSVHSLPSRINHQRTAINKGTFVKNLFFTPKNIQPNTLTLNYNNINNKNNDNVENIKTKYNNINNLNTYLNEPFLQKTPNASVLNYSYAFMYNKNGTAIGIGADDCKKVYSKDYVNELKIMHDQEKEELKFKITTLENTINRIKSSFNEQIEKVKFTQVTTEKECNDKIELIKKEYELKIESIEKEKEYKDNQISNLNEQILEQKKIYEKKYNSFNELKNNYNNLENEHKLLNKEYNTLENKSKKEYETINQKLIETIKSYEQYKQQKELDMRKLIDENNKKINDIQQQNNLQIKEIELNHKDTSKNELDNLTTFLTDKYEKIIKEITNENNNLKKDNAILIEKMKISEEKNKKENDLNDKNINLLKNENDEKNKKIKETQKNFDEIVYKNKELENSVLDLKKQIEEYKQKLNNKNKDISNLNEQILILNNEIKSIKSTNDVITDKFKKLQEENKKLKVDLDAVDIECNNKLKNYKFIEERNIMLESENEKLKNKIDKYIKPLSFNYTYAQ